MQSAEVIIIGAGPAGSAAALLLARQRREVLLVDQARFPRDKPCGEYLNPAAVAILYRLGLAQAVEAAGAHAVIGAYLTSPAGRGVRVAYPSLPSGVPPRGLSVPRLALDAVLVRAAQAAGARLWEGFRVDDLLRSGRRVAGVVGRSEGGTETVRARLVLAADGSRSVAGRRLGVMREPPAPQRFGLVAHYEGVDGDDWVEMHAGRRGYCGLGYSADGGANVAMVAESADLPRLRGRAEAFYEERLAQFPAVARRLAAGRRVGRVLVTGSMSSRVASVAAPGLLLVGDAAGFYDPFTGEGISYALRGAELAAAAADAALGGRVRGSGLNHRDAEDAEGISETGRWEMTGIGRSGQHSCLMPHLPSVPSPCPPCLCGSIDPGSREAQAFREYAARRREEFAPRVLVSRMIQAVLRRPWLLEAVFHRFEADPPLAQRLIGVTAGVLPPSVVLSPAYLAQLLGSGVLVGRQERRNARTPERLNT